MESPSRRTSPTAEVVFRDGFGDRVLLRDPEGRPLQESLILTNELSAVRTFEFSLTQRLGELEAFDHPSFARIRKVMQMGGTSPRLCVVYDHVPGSRLSAILSAMEQKGATNPVDAALLLVRQILEAMTALHRHGPDLTHGALGPERIILSDGRVRITDYVMGSAIGQLRYSSERYWKDLRVAVAPVPGAIQFDPRVDVAQVAFIALALFSSRLLREDEGMMYLEESRIMPSLSRPLRSWLIRSLHVDQRHGLFTMSDSLNALDQAIAESKAPAAPRAPAVRPAPMPPPSPSPRVQKPPTMVPKAPPRIEPRTGTMFQPGARLEESASSFGGVQRTRLKTLVKVAGLVAVIAGAFAAAKYVPAPSLFSREGTLAVESNPKGAQLLVDGHAVGTTPLTVTLRNGQHEIELRIGQRSRAFNVSITAGNHVTQYVEMFPEKP